MSTTSIVRGKTLPDSGTKNDLHELIDLSTVTVSNIVNADISNSAAIAGSKVSPNFGAQNIVAADATLSGDVIVSGTTDLGGALTLTGALDVTGDSTFTGDIVNDRIIKAWAYVDSLGVIQDSFNVASVSNTGTGRYTINWDTDFAGTDYVVMVTQVGVNSGGSASNLAAGSCDIATQLFSLSPSSQDFFVIAIGDQ